MTWSAGKRERASHDMLGSTQFWLDEKSGGKFFKSRSRSVVMCAWVKLDGPRRVHAHKVQARIQGRWNGWIFISLFLSSLLSFFSYPSNVEIIFDFSYFSDWGWKNSPSISKSWIRAWSKRTEHLRRSSENGSNRLNLNLNAKCPVWKDTFASWQVCQYTMIFS